MKNIQLLAPPPNNKHEHLTHPKYRADIDGLRAVAVLSVVCFHAFPIGLKGGFIGVDIFFVISGFLISTIIFENLDKGTFSFSEFYARRINRIFPALILVLISCFAFGWFELLADEYKQLGKHIAAGAGFVSNFVFWNESGYFDNSAETKPLLHLWTLGIEEQFYIVWPLLLWAAWKRKFNLLSLTLVITTLSFALNIKGLHSDAVATFYSPQTRFWELLIGSTLAYVTLYKPNLLATKKQKLNTYLNAIIYAPSSQSNDNTLRNTQAILGVTLIGIGLLLITKERHFPGTWALLPTLGAVLIISAGSQAWLNRVILSNRILVWFGLISFPLYLWHWPLLSFARIVESETPARNIRIAAVVISILLAWLTYKFIEKPIRFGKFGNTKTIVLSVLMVVVGTGGIITKTESGFDFRRVAQMNASISSGNDGGISVPLIPECGLNDIEKTKFANCFKDSRQPVKYALLGDSKAAALISGLIRTSNENGRWLFIGGNGPNNAPVPVISNNDMYKKFQHLTPTAVKVISENPNIEKVVLVTAVRQLFGLNSLTNIDDLPSNKNFAIALEGLNETVRQFTLTGKKIVLVIDNPTLPQPEDCLGRETGISLINSIIQKTNPRCHIPIEKHIKLSEQYHKLLYTIQEQYPLSVKVFDTTKHMCDYKEGFCNPTKNGRFLYSYWDHISDYASGQIGIGLNAFLQTF